MPRKGSKIASKSKSQPTLSKFFVGESEYPTTILNFKKRQIESIKTVFDNSTASKIQKREELVASVTAKHHGRTNDRLSSFTFKKNLTLQSENELNKNSDVLLDSEKLQNHAKVFKGKTTQNEKIKYTPLEKQYLEFKAECPDAVLMIECGYKYRFFGEDAEIASRVLNIGCFPYHNFISAIIPVPRLHFHVRRLVARGYKVGVVKQTESTALKAASDTKNELFARKLNCFYTKSTLIGEEFHTSNCSTSDDEQEAEPEENTSGYLLCISEKPSSTQKQTYDIAVVGVNLSSGDVSYSVMEDSKLRNKLENRLVHYNPSEILLSSFSSCDTEKLIHCINQERFIRVEKLDQENFNSQTAYKTVSDFYSGSESVADKYIQLVLSLPELVISCLSCLIIHLKKFKLENVLRNCHNMRPLSQNEYMILNASTMKGLEIMKGSVSNNLTDSLYGVINQTFTKFGDRLLKSWISKPLKSLKCIDERLSIVTEIINSDSEVFKIVKKMMKTMPDLERILCCVFHCKCNCKDFIKLLISLADIKTRICSIMDKILTDVQNSRLKLLLTNLPELLQNAESFLKNINLESLNEDDKSKIFCDTSMFPSLKNCQNEIESIERNLNELKPKIAKTLHLISVKYATVAGQKYLLEVPNSHLSVVPSDWLKVSSTKQVSRFRSPEIIKLLHELERQQEMMATHANEAWSSFLKEFGNDFHKYKQAISHLAELDCYFSLAEVAKTEKYTKPNFSSSADRSFHIVQGRHPVITKAMGEGSQFVANNINMSRTNNCIIITGPNMGGKSTYVRQFALISIMAQIGSYVPAESAILPVFDGIYVRMGADDDLVHRKSTFMSEMSETSEILQNATADSLVILDELGRGTSTNDGASVAYATLEHLITVTKCVTLFVTHYPTVAELQNLYPSHISTVHMSYILNEKCQDEDIETVTFLYTSMSGVSEKSYGINVAALTGIKKEILLEAQRKSYMVELQEKIQRSLKILIKQGLQSSINL